MGRALFIQAVSKGRWSFDEPNFYSGFRLEDVYREMDKQSYSDIINIYGNQMIHGLCLPGGAASASNYSRLRPGDMVLIVIEDRVEYAGQVTYKIKSNMLAKKLWPKTGGDAGYVLILDRPIQLDLSVRQLNENLGYQEDYLPKGFSHVSDDKTDSLVKKYTGLREFIDYLHSTEWRDDEIQEVDEVELDEGMESLDDALRLEKERLSEQKKFLADEKESRFHLELLKSVSDYFQGEGLKPKTGRIDLLVEDKKKIYFFELKCVHTRKFKKAATEALGRILEHEYYDVKSKKTVEKIVLFNKKPSKKVVKYLNHNDVKVWWTCRGKIRKQG